MTTDRDADIVGISTHNSSDEPNKLLHSCPLHCIHKTPSPPNPIHGAGKGVRGMLDIVKDIPFWKKVLGKSRVCMSVTSAINFASSTAIPIDFKQDLLGDGDNVQRYSRRRFLNHHREGTKIYRGVFPVDYHKMDYHWDATTRTHFWRYIQKPGGELLKVFAYDQAESLRSKVKDLLNAYPGDRCLVFDDLGDDSYGRKISTRSRQIKFEKFELLKAVAAEMTARYGPAFPPKYY